MFYDGRLLQIIITFWLFHVYFSVKIFVSGPFSLTAKMVCLEGSMDALVLIDALAIIMGHEEKELCKPGQAALALILQTATNILGSKDRVGGHFKKLLIPFPLKYQSQG